MKSAWRRVAPVSCLNCSGETFLVNFGLRQVGMSNRCWFVEHVCGACRRLLRDETMDMKAWMMASLDVDVLPGYETVWGKRVKLDGKATG